MTRIASFSSFHVFAPMLLLLAASACDTNADLEPPLLTIRSAEPEPYPDMVCGTEEPTVYHLSGGDTLTLDLLLQDNEALSQAKVDIHANFDCHGHARLAGPDTEDWSVLNLQDVTGTEAEWPLSLVAPANPTAGNYHFQLRLVDDAGNEDPNPNVFAIQLSNAQDTTAPSLVAQNPPLVATLNFVRGNAYNFDFRAIDNRPLGEGGNGKVALRYTREETGNTFTAVEQEFAAGSGMDELTVLTFSVPETVIPGAYTVELLVWDGVNNAGTPITWPAIFSD